MTATPRIRNDLQATPNEEQGIRYYDVSDPRSGARMRLYDFEWLIASRMDGARQFDEVATWAQRQFGIASDAGALETYARTLEGYGFFELSGAVGVPALADDETVPSDFDDKTSSFSEEPTVAKAEPPRKRERGPSDTLLEMPAVVPMRKEREDATEASPPPAASRPSSGIQPSGIQPLKPVANPAPVPAPIKPITAAPRPQAVDPFEDDPPKKSNTASIVGLILVVLAVGGGVLWVKVIAPKMIPKVTVEAVASHDVVQLQEGSSPAHRGEESTLSFGEGGRITDIVAPNTEVKPGAPLATLEGYLKIEKDLADLNEKLAWFEKEMARLKAKGSPVEIAKLDAKMKPKVLAKTELQARASRVRLLAPTGGVVSQVLATAGAVAKAGEPVIKLGGKTWSADFKLPPAEAATFKPGAAVSTSIDGPKGARAVPGRVTKVEPTGAIAVELEDPTIKDGEQVRLVKGRAKSVIAVAPTSVVQRNGLDVVFLVADGKAQMRQVKIGEKTPTEIQISEGLAPGEQVITSNLEKIHDGQAVAVQ